MKKYRIFFGNQEVTFEGKLSLENHCKDDYYYFTNIVGQTFTELRIPVSNSMVLTLS